MIYKQFNIHHYAKEADLLEHGWFRSGCIEGDMQREGISKRGAAWFCNL